MKKDKLPINWNELIHFERELWLMDHYSTNEIDENGNLVYDTESMPEDVLQAYKDVIESKRKAKKQGYLFD